MSSVSYTHIVNGIHIPLRRFENIGFITPARDQNLNHIAARLSQSTRLALDQNYPYEALVVWGDRGKLEEIKSYTDVKNTRCALQDPSGKILILTNEILIRFKNSSSEKERNKLLSNFDGQVIHKNVNYWKFHVNSPLDDAPIQISQYLSSENIVEYAEPNALQEAIFHQLSSENEPRFPNQWHLKNTGQNGGVRGADVNAIGAWSITTGSPNIKIVVHDTGVDINHPDLIPNIDEGWDFDNSDYNASNDNEPHGTACAGIIGAAVNGRGVTGIAPGCRIIPLRAANPHSWEVWAKTFDWAAQHGHIISCSWSITPSNILSNAIRLAVKKNVTIFCAAGNGNSEFETEFPAKLKETIAVGASTNKNIVSIYSQGGSGLDVVAPSSGGTLRIETTDIQGKNGYNKANSPDGDYCIATENNGFGGTSAATPLVAGIAGLMLSVNPKLTPTDIRDILHQTADKIDTGNAAYNSKGWSRKYGYGKVNAAKAVKLALKY